MSVLLFPVVEVRRLIDHAKSAPQHRRGYGDTKPAHPCLMLVHDEGVYLMSNGMPGLMREDGKSHVVCYARGLDPTARDRMEVWHAARAAVGGDDFVEYIPVALFILDGKQDGDTCLIRITADSLTMR